MKKRRSYPNEGHLFGAMGGCVLTLSLIALTDCGGGSTSSPTASPSPVATAVAKQSFPTCSKVVGGPEVDRFTNEPILGANGKQVVDVPTALTGKATCDQVSVAVAKGVATYAFTGAHFKGIVQPPVPIDPRLNVTGTPYRVSVQTDSVKSISFAVVDRFGKVVPVTGKVGFLAVVYPLPGASAAHRGK